MKHLIYILVILTVFSSCKRKKYNCRCSTTVIYSSSQTSYSSKNTPINKKMTEKEATAVCSHEAQSINSTYTNYITNNGNWSSNGLKASTVCSLQ